MACDVNANTTSVIIICSIVTPSEVYIVFVSYYVTIHAVVVSKVISVIGIINVTVVY